MHLEQYYKTYDNNNNIEHMFDDRYNPLVETNETQNI